MNLSFSIPLRLSWERMQRVLFRPFRLNTWLVLGFAAFLSDFLSGRSGGSSSWRSHGDGNHPSLRAIGAFLLHPVWSGVVLTVLTIVIVLFFVLQWVSCRGRFIFLDDVVQERARIVEPWNRFARLGNSLFGWTVVFWLVCIAILIVIATPYMAAVGAVLTQHRFEWAAFGAVVGLLAWIVPFALLVAFTLMLLDHFVVPVMYRQGVGVVAAWSRVLSLLGAHPGAFLLYAVLMLVAGAAVVAAVIAVGFGTCCVGFVLVALPYVGQVVLLPVHVLFRAYGPHFLAQFGPDVDAFAGAPPAAAASPPASPPA